MKPAITIDQISAFLWVARLGGVRRAAEHMNLSQPAISARISALETQISTKLFDRGPAGVRLTRKGELFLTHAEHIALALEAIRTEIVEASDLDGALRIGVAETIAQAWLPDFVARLSDRYPALSIEVTVDISRNLRASLLARALDLAILMGPVSDFTIENADLPEFELEWYRAADRSAVDLATVPVISYARNTRPFREMRDELLARHGPGVRVFPTTSLSAGFQMVAADLGVGALPKALARGLVDAGEIERFDPGWCPPALQFTASWRSEAGSAIAREAARIARDAALAHAAAAGGGAGDR